MEQPTDKQNISTSLVDYDVGYKKPPKDSQFKPHKSGNPAGRPPGSKNKIKDQMFVEIFIEEAQRIVEFKDGRESDLSFARAIHRALLNKAAKGDMRAIELALRKADQIDTEKLRLSNELMATWIPYKIKCEKEIMRCEKEGKAPPEFFPHPNQVVFADGEVSLVGPLTWEDKKKFEAERTVAREVGDYLLDKVRAEIAAFQQQLCEETTPKQRRNLQKKLTAAEDRSTEIEIRKRQFLAEPWE